MNEKKKQISRRSTTLAETIMLAFNRNFSRAIIFFITVSICLGCQDKKDKCLQSLQEFSKLSAKEKDSSVLIQMLDKLVASNSECFDLFLIRGDINLSRGNIEAAYHDFTSVTKGNNKNIYALYSLGIIYNQWQKFDSAIAILQTAINYKRQSSVVVDYNNSALMKEKAKYDVEYNELLFTQALSYYYKRDLKKASATFSYLISNQYRLGESYLYRGVIAIEAERNYSAACEDIRFAELYGNKAGYIYEKRFCH